MVDVGLGREVVDDPGTEPRGATQSSRRKPAIAGRFQRCRATGAVEHIPERPAGTGEADDRQLRSSGSAAKSALPRSARRGTARGSSFASISRPKPACRGDYRSSTASTPAARSPRRQLVEVQLSAWSSASPSRSSRRAPPGLAAAVVLGAAPKTASASAVAHGSPRCIRLENHCAGTSSPSARAADRDDPGRARRDGPAP